MTKGFCIKVLKAALATGHRPEIFNTDQGSQFTSNEFIDVLKDHKISMDGRGRALDVRQCLYREIMVVSQIRKCLP